MPYNWKNMNVVPRDGLEAWHHLEPGVSGHNIIYDSSGKNRTIQSGTGNSAVLTQAAAANNQFGWYFNGSRDPLVYSGNLTVKHIFIVAGYEDAAFSDFNGLLTGITNGDILVGNSGTNKFFDFAYSNYTYRKSDVIYASNDQKSPMSNNIAVLELIKTDGFSLDGIQIGQQRGFTTRKWKGFFFEQLLYSTVKTELERYQIYQYFAMRYYLWQKNAAGLNIFPFPANKTRNVEREREHYVSEPYSGAKKALVRDIKRDFKLPFSLRIQPEFEAAEAFHAAHYPLTNFVLRDYRFYPYRDTTAEIISSLNEEGSDVSYRFNYSFNAREVV